MSTSTYLFPPELATYVQRTWIDEPDVLRELREETGRTMENANMQISPDLGQFLTVLLRSIGARRTLEVGVFTGYSSTATALALPSDGRIIACDVSEEFTAMARRTWERAGVAAKIDLRLAPARDTLDSLLDGGEQGTFDFAFIDADKRGYRDYFDRCVSLVRRGGLIAIDNVLWGGRVADDSNQEEDTNFIREFNAHVHADPRVLACLVPIGDGVTLAYRL